MRRLAGMMVAVSLAAGTARALEVSLEENKAQRGSIGFVDTQRLFRLYPETQKAKGNFEEVLRQAEEQVNLRKAELIGLRADVIKLRLERDAAAKLAAGIQAAQAALPPAQAQPPAASTAAAVATTTPAPGAAIAVATSTGSATLAVSTSTGAAAPGVATSTAAAHGVAASTATAPAAIQTAAAVAGVAGSTSPVTLVPVSRPPPASAPDDKGAPLIINLPGLSPEPMVMQPPAEAIQAAKSLTDLENRLAEKTRLLQDKEAEFKVYQAQVEKNLLDLEDKKTEILLGKIYRAVQEVAREEGVSVVVDRTQILFGQQAMDLTEKVLKKLKSQS